MSRLARISLVILARVGDGDRTRVVVRIGDGDLARRYDRSGERSLNDLFNLVRTENYTTWYNLASNRGRGDTVAPSSWFVWAYHSFQLSKDALLASIPIFDHHNHQVCPTCLELHPNLPLTRPVWLENEQSIYKRKSYFFRNDRISCSVANKVLLDSSLWLSNFEFAKIVLKRKVKVKAKLDQIT